MENKEIQYSVVVPVYNEELLIYKIYKRLKEVMDYTKESYEIIFVDDGSRDKTAEMIRTICREDKNVRLIGFYRNFGHQVAITAGMDYSIGKAVVVMNVELQAPLEVLLEMFRKWKDGYEVVYGKRLKQKKDTFLKKISTKALYKALNIIADIDIPANMGDFRLIDRKVCDVLKSIPERNRYARGLVKWLGFKHTDVEFIGEKRFTKDTDCILKRVIRFTSHTITTLSYKPSRMVTYTGVVITVLSIAYMIFKLLERIFTNLASSGWTSIIVLSMLFNGLTFIMLGIIGEYAGSVYNEAKGEPIYIIGDKEGFN